MYYLGVSLPKRSMVFLANGYMSRTKFMLYGVLDFFRGETGKGRLSGKIIKELKELKIRKEEKQDKNKRCLRIGINARYLENPETGIEKYLRFLVNNLVMIDKKNDYVLFYRNNSSSRIVESRKISEIKTGMGDWNVFCRIFYEQFLLWRDIKNEKVDIFHGPSFMVPFFKPKGCKYIVTIMDLSYLTCPESYTFLNRLYFHLFLKRSMTIADKIIAISESTKKEIMHNFRIHADKIVVTHLAVEEKYKLIKDNEKRINVQRKYGLPEKFMLCVGSLIPRKNIKRIIEAFKKIKGDGLPHKLVVVGKKGWLYDDIFHYIDEHNLKEDIHFTGYVGYDDLPVIYCLADLFVYPSLEEGFGLPILEAFACECPVLTSNTSSMPEVAGDAAYLINPLSIDEIADGMKEMLTNKKLRVQLIKKGKGRVNDFSWKMAAEKTLNTYIKL
jgi:glycosyltransferase involved in cell wall biosynthesis